MAGSEERRGISLHGFLLPLFPFRPSRENSPSWTKWWKYGQSTFHEWRNTSENITTQRSKSGSIIGFLWSQQKTKFPKFEWNLIEHSFIPSKLFRFVNSFKLHIVYFYYCFERGKMNEFILSSHKKMGQHAG